MKVVYFEVRTEEGLVAAFRFREHAEMFAHIFGGHVVAKTKEVREKKGKA